MTSSEDIKWIQYEPGTPEFDVYDGLARDLANTANDCFVEQEKVAMELAGSYKKYDPGFFLKMYMLADENYTSAKLAAARRMPERVAFEQSHHEPESEPFTLPEIRNAINSEQHAKASEIRTDLTGGELPDTSIHRSTLWG